MSALGRKLRQLEGGSVSFKCPGCGDWHMLNVSGAGRPRWEFNGDGDAPTFTPSILYRSGHYAPNRSDDNCWCNFEERTGNKADFECVICHSFVTDGRIRFLNDCTHELAGQTVDLPDLEMGP